MKKVLILAVGILALLGLSFLSVVLAARAADPDEEN